MAKRGRPPKNANINAIDKKEVEEEIESRKETPLQRLRRKAKEERLKVKRS